MPANTSLAASSLLSNLYLLAPSQVTDKIKLIKRGATCSAGSFEDQVNKFVDITGSNTGEIEDQVGQVRWRTLTSANHAAP